MTDYRSYDLIVIGGGPAGITAALRARELGARTALIERGLLGGTCTNDGCVPTRVLAKAARLYRDTELFDLYGLEAGRPGVNFGRLMERAQQVVYQVQEKKQLTDHLQSSGVKVFENVGAAKFASAHQVELADGTILVGKNILICAGGHARKLPVPGGDLALTHSDIWRMQTLPKTIGIVGGSATGLQLATIFQTFGARVTVIEMAGRLLSPEDALISAEIERAFRDQGVQVFTGAAVQAVETNGEGYTLIYTYEGAEQRSTFETVVSAVGWPGNLEALNLPAAGIETHGAYIAVNDYLQTQVENIYAAGDITGKMMLVQTASQQARCAVENILANAKHKYEAPFVPHGGFTDPDYASVGLTEAKANEQLGEDKVAVVTVPFNEIDRAVIDGRTEGYCKLVVNRETHEIIGAHVVGEQAIELINMVAVGMIDGLKVDSFAGLDFAYPSFSSVIALAARQISRELRLVPVVSRWHELGHMRLAEWEAGAP
ncbi:MAG: NAD(P)/FAD-dependent oxidoreductase [Anaerolineae bacterium]|nr:NAD(P)/FAD-dependent oxidoreductase [Anaerolineae bacterium]